MNDIKRRLEDAHENSQQRIVGSSIFADAAAELSRLEADVERLCDQRDAAIMEVSRQAAARGRAEGVLATSETAGVVEGWRARAEAAEARVKSLLDLLAKNPAALAQLFPQQPLDADMARIWSENIDRMYES